MRREPSQSPQATWLSAGLAAGLIGLLATSAGYNARPKVSAQLGSGEPFVFFSKRVDPSRVALAAARVDLAKSTLARNAPDDALSLLVAALEADPASEEARTMAVDILTKTRWHLPGTTLEHHLPVEFVDFAAPSSLWVGLSGGTNTVVRWNTEPPRIEAILFPVKTPEIRSMVFDQGHKTVVIERAGNTLLCDAQTLKPIRDLGPLPDYPTPSSVVVFSPEGLLLAHPAFVSESNHALVWHLRDAATGEILRTSEPLAPDKPRPLAAFLDRKKLLVLHADGGLLEMPVSPVEAITTTPPKELVTLRHARFSASGGSAMILKDLGPHHAPELSTLSFDGMATENPAPLALLETSPWNLHPGIWSGMLREAGNSPLVFTDPTTCQLPAPHAPIHSQSTITALAMCDDRVVTGESNGAVTIYQTLPLPVQTGKTHKPGTLDSKAVSTFADLTFFLAGTRYDPTTRLITRCDYAQRMSEHKACDLDSLTLIFPELDFSALVGHMEPRTADPELLIPFWDRLARADASGASWPALLDLSKDLNDNAWHRNIAAAVDARMSGDPIDPESSTWFAPQAIEKTFTKGDEDAIEAAIQSVGSQGPSAAKAFELALASTHPEWIDACLAKASNLPPLLRQLAISRIAWLQDRRADALLGWPVVFPDFQQVRQREDWDGWEQADFSQAYEKLRLCLEEELNALVLPANSTPEQRKAVADHFADPATIKAVGHARFARACIKAAFAFSAFKEYKETTFKLASIARDLGEAAEPCLRAEAMALTALGDYKHAHERWITLITEHPVNTQEPGDYAEAAYTAFENSNPQQAMTILTTGLHRFPNDANFALRAGWVALLTGNAERAYRFLLTGRQIGYPQEKLENATALLAIAASQTGAVEDAAAFYQDLIDLDPVWKKTETLETLDWPEELKASLRQLVWQLDK